MRLAIAILLQIAALASFLIWGLTALFAPMLLSGANTFGTWIVFAVFLIMPAAMVIASIAVWAGFVKRNNAIMGMSAVFILLSYVIVLGSVGA